MVEVFKTNVDNIAICHQLVHELQSLDSLYQVNFDLEDCDRILRIENREGTIECDGVIKTLARFGFSAEILSN